MPVEKKITKRIERIYKNNAENIMLFTWVKAQRDILPTMRIEQSILGFFRSMDISIEDWDLDSAKATFSRLQKEYIDDCKT